MAVTSNWTPEIFSSALGGVNSGQSPEQIGPSQFAWMLNASARGGKPSTRPPLKFRMLLPPGLVQGAGYFGVQNGMIVTSIRGHLYRLRMRGVWDEIALPWRNSALLKQVWMQQTVESFIVQDFESDPIIYDGSTARRSDVLTEVPRGRMMAYGNGRLWVAVNDKELAAGDVRSRIAGSELKFTERNFLLGGGDLSFSNGIKALFFIATNGTSDVGPLAVAGDNYTESVRADITSRDQWGIPGFVTNVLRKIGCVSHWSVVPVNQDVYWRDADGGLRSVYSAGTDESTAGNSPLSREVARLTDFDSKQLLKFCSGVYFDNRLLMTSSPFLNEVGGVSWRDLIALDFTPNASMQGKAAPAYDGQWNGLYVTHLVTGQFEGRPRAFAIAHESTGSNSLWEIMPTEVGQRDDESVICSGTGPTVQPSRIQAYAETGRRNFGDIKIRKRIERTDLYLSDIDGEVNVKVWWRKDTTKKWTYWDTFTVCSKMTDPTMGTPRTRLNMYRQQRSQVKTLTIPATPVASDKYAQQTGFEFQIRVGWVGRCKLYKAILFASPLPDPAWARRDLVTENCLLSDSTGNEIGYHVAFEGNPAIIDSQPVGLNIVVGDGASFSFGIIGSEPISYQWQVSSGSGGAWTDVADGEVYSGAQDSTLTLTGVPIEFNGLKYRCIANNGWTVANCIGGTSTQLVSSEAPLGVSEACIPPEITLQPVTHEDLINIPGAQTQVVAASGTEPLSYQWQTAVERYPQDLTWADPDSDAWGNVVDQDSLTFTGANTDTLHISYPGTPYYLSRAFRCIVTNACGTATSDPGYLVWLSPD
jgi:hypothetical protein